MTRLAIIGSPGSGKSWLAERLAALTGLPLDHLDDHYWHGDWTPTPAAEWRQSVAALVARPRWIIDGHYQPTIDLVLGAAGHVVVLDLPVARCLYGVLRRYARVAVGDRTPLPARLRAQRKRPAPGTGVGAFMRFVARFPRQQLPAAMQLIERRPALRVVVLRRRSEASAFVADVARYGTERAFALRCARSELPSAALVG